MHENEQQLLLNLLTEQRVAALGVEIDDAPFVSLMPFAMTEGFEAVLIHASQLAVHSAGLIAGAPFSLLIHEPDCQPATNPAQLARVTLRGDIQTLEDRSKSYAAARDHYLAKYPKSAITFNLGDFRLYVLKIAACRFVAGFGRAFDIDPTELAELA